jgi:ABC-type uncharacterized transport system ATPase component
MAASGLEARAPRALGPAGLFFALMTVARFHHNGEIAQLIIDHVLRPAFCLCFCRQLLSSGQVIKNYELKKNQDSEVLPSLKKSKNQNKRKAKQKPKTERRFDLT